MLHFVQVVILSLILAWGMYKLSEIPVELMVIMGIERKQKRKNLARSLATQRDPHSTMITYNMQGA